jgi:hypothetical protein
MASKKITIHLTRGTPIRRAGRTWSKHEGEPVSEEDFTPEQWKQLLEDPSLRVVGYKPEMKVHSLVELKKQPLEILQGLARERGLDDGSVRTTDEMAKAIVEADKQRARHMQDMLKEQAKPAEPTVSDTTNAGTEGGRRR